MKAKVVVDKESDTMRRDLTEYVAYAQNPFPGKEFQVLLPIFAVEFSPEGLICKFDGIELEDGNKANYLRYGFRKRSAKLDAVTITAKMCDNTWEFEAFSKQLDQCIEFARSINLEEEVQLLIALRTCVIDQEAAICDELNGVHESFNKDERKQLLFSLRIDSGESRRYLGELEAIQQQIIYSLSDDMANTRGSRVDPDPNCRENF